VPDPPVEDAAPVAPVHLQAPGAVNTWRDFFVQLVIVTVGVLIALLLQGLVDWQRGQALVREARANIRQELQENLREVDLEIAGLAKREANLDNCLKFAEDLLANGKTDINAFELGLSFAELGSASWQSAERTGALALMEYRDVQTLSKQYDKQDLYVAAQRRAMDRLANAFGVVPDATKATKAARADLEAFRREIQALQASLLIEKQLAEQLSRSYKSTIADVFE
jgi:hypothetical protein